MKKNIFMSMAIAVATFMGAVHADFTIVNKTDVVILVEPYSDANHPPCPLDAGQSDVVGAQRTEKFTNGGRANCFYKLQAILNPPYVPQRSIILIPDSLSQFLGQQTNGTATIFPDGYNNFRIQFSK